MADRIEAAGSLLRVDHMLDNAVFAGGIGLASVGAAAALARRGAVQAVRLLRRQLLVNVEISKRDHSYRWVLAWLSQPRDNSGFLASRVTRLRDLAVSTTTTGPAPKNSGDAADGGSTQTHIMVQPGFGRHVIRAARGVYVAVTREKLGTTATATGEPHETLTMTALWAHRHIFETVFGEAHALAQKYHEDRTVVYAAQRIGSWEPLGKARAKRRLESVVLDKGVRERLAGDVHEFLAARQWYLDRGVPYRRGYLLYGPPGTGKTSFIYALAGDLGYSVAMVNLGETGMTDDKLAHLLTQTPERSILVLEDVDAALGNSRKRGAGSTVTFSGLLNALDGLAAGEDRIAFLTTNHVDRLDPALIRPGRVDVTMRIGEATSHQAREMWKRFYGEADADGSGCDRFVARLEELGLFGDTPARQTSTAAIQGLFQLNKKDMEGAINMAAILVRPDLTA